MHTINAQHWACISFTLLKKILCQRYQIRNKSHCGLPYVSQVVALTNVWVKWYILEVGKHRLVKEKRYEAGKKENYLRVREWAGNHYRQLWAQSWWGSQWGVEYVSCSYLWVEKLEYLSTNTHPLLGESWSQGCNLTLESSTYCG